MSLFTPFYNKIMQPRRHRSQEAFGKGWNEVPWFAYTYGGEVGVPEQGGQAIELASLIGLSAGALLLGPTAWLLYKDALGRRRLVLQNERWRTHLLESFNEPSATLDETSPLLPHRTSGTTRGVRLTWALRPDGVKPFANLTLEIERAEHLARIPPMQLSWRGGERALPEEKIAHPSWRFLDRDFDQHFHYGGDEERLLSSLWHGARDVLIGLSALARWRTCWLFVDGNRFSARWRIPQREIEDPAVYAMLRSAVELGIELCAPREAIIPSRLSSYVEEDESPSSARALELLFRDHRDSAAAARAIRTIRAHKSLGSVLIATLHAPDLIVEDLQWLAIDDGMRHHPELSWRRDALQAALERGLLGHPLLQTALEHMAINEPDPELRARAQTHALRTGKESPYIDSASVMLAAQRLLKHTRTLAPTTRQRLELALMQTSAKPGLQTYIRLAERSTDKILRYSSLRALYSKFSHEPEALATLAARTHAEPITWISDWCQKALEEASRDKASSKILEEIARDTSRALRTRMIAACAVPLRMGSLLMRFIISQELSLQERMGVARVLTRTSQGERARKAFKQSIRNVRPDERDAIFIALAMASDLVWPLELISTHVASVPAHTRCAILDDWLAREAFERPELGFIELITVMMLDDRDDAVHRRAAQLLSEFGTSRVVPRLRLMLAREEARSVGLRTQHELQRLLKLESIIKAIHSRVDQIDGALTLSRPNDHRGAITMTEVRGQLELLDD